MQDHVDRRTTDSTAEIPPPARNEYLDAAEAITETFAALLLPGRGRS
jgi:hypothetical protein